METKFTKGPWKASKNSSFWDVENKDQEKSILSINVILYEDRFYFNGISHSEENAANAQLIAAAPEMFDMLSYLNARGGLGLDTHEAIKTLLNKITTL